MKTFFEITSYQLATGKWIARYNEIIRTKSKVSMQESSFNRQFDSKEEADRYATKYCLQQEYIPEE